MCKMDPTEILDELERLAVKVVGQRERPAGRAEWIDNALALRDALAVIRDAVDDLDYEIARRFDAESLVTKRCANCRHWMVVNTVGRRRRTCSAACRKARERA